MMSESITIPVSFNTSATTNPEVFYAEVFDNLMKKLCIHAPGIIEAYDRATHIARVRPMVKLQYTNGEIKDAQPITVEIHRMCAGGFVIDFPIKEGDTGWFFSCDQDVTQIKESHETGLPSSAERHSFKRGFWIPDYWGELELAGNAVDALSIQAIDGSSTIVVGNGKVEIVTNDKIYAKSSAIDIVGNTTITGNLTVSGVTTTGGINLNTHQHTDSMGGVTSAPI